MGATSGAVFIGRAAELARLDAALDVTAGGAFRIVVIGGEAGVGKTRLLDEFLAGTSDVQVLLGSCLPLEAASVPYAPIVEALRALVRSVDPGAVPALLGPARAELGRLIPELADDGDRPHPSLPPEPTAQARLFEHVLGVVDRLARRTPVVLAIEDIQWSDAGTRDLVAFLVRNLRRTPVLLVVTARSDELTDDHQVLPLLAELERHGSAERIELGRLERRDVQALVHSLTGAEPRAAALDRIAVRSDGNPFFVEQLVASGEHDERLPARLADILRARIGRLSGTCRTVLRAMATAGRPVDEGLLAEATRLPQGTVEAALREAIGQRVVVHETSPADEGRYAFVHALLREVVDVDLLPAERRRLHGAFAAALSRDVDAATARPATQSSELAFHWEAAGAWGPALAAHIDAGVAAETVYAWTAAMHHFERSLALLDRAPAATPPGFDRVEILRRAADAAFLTADYARAIAWGREAIALAGPTDPARAGLLHERMRWYLWDAGDRQGAVAAVKEALRLLPPDPPTVARAFALAQWASVLIHGGRVAEAQAAAKEALALAHVTGSRPAAALAVAVVGWTDVIVGNVQDGLDALREALEITEETEDVSGIALGHALLAVLLYRVGRPAEAREAALAGHARIVELGAELTYGGVLLGYATKSHIALGDWDEADRLVAAGFEHDPVGRPAHWLRINRARLATLRGRWEAAAADLDTARAFEVASGGTEDGEELLAAEAELAAWTGDVASSRAAFDEGTQRAGPAPLSPTLGRLAAHAMRAEADEARSARRRRNRGREDVAAERATAIDGFAHAIPSDGPIGSDELRALDLLVRAEGTRLADGADPAPWAATLEAWRRAGRPFDAAYAGFRLAEALIAGDGSRADAHALLVAARGVCTTLRAEPLAREIDRLARRARLVLEPATDGPPTSGVTTAGIPFRLTAREAEVLRLLVGGWTNRQIADELFIAPKTATVHVTNIFGKLGVNSRIAAAALAHRLGLVPDAPLPPDSEVDRAPGA